MASVAFSQLGFSAAYAGFGAGTTVRSNTAFTYRLNYQGVRFGAQAQVGGYELGNASTGQYQFLIGTDFGNLSLDAIGGWANNAVSLASYAGGALPAGYDPYSILKATVQQRRLRIDGRVQVGQVQILCWLCFRPDQQSEQHHYPGGLQRSFREVVFRSAGRRNLKRLICRATEHGLDRPQICRDEKSRTRRRRLLGEPERLFAGT